MKGSVLFPGAGEEVRRVWGVSFQLASRLLVTITLCETANVAMTTGKSFVVRQVILLLPACHSRRKTEEIASRLTVPQNCHST